jgi:hypothetical protein
MLRYYGANATRQLTRPASRLRSQMVKVEAVMKLLDRISMPVRYQPSGATWAIPGSSAALYIGVLWTCCGGLPALAESGDLLAGKTPVPTRKQEEALQAAIPSALRVRNGNWLARVRQPAGL